MDSNGDFLNKKNVKTMYFWSCYKVLSCIFNSVYFSLFINHCIVWRYCCLNKKKKIIQDDYINKLVDIRCALSWTSLASAVSAQTCTHLKSGYEYFLFVLKKSIEIKILKYNVIFKDKLIKVVYIKLSRSAANRLLHRKCHPSVCREWFGPLF